MPGSRSSSALTMLLLPPPDGAATTNRQPDAPGLRVVMVMFWRSFSASLQRVGLPRSARRRALRALARFPRPPCSLEVLHLLAPLLDQHLWLEGGLRKPPLGGLRSPRGWLPVGLPRKKIEAAPGRAPP